MTAAWDRHDAWFTAGDLAEQGLRGAQALRIRRPRVVVDVGAGGGIFGARASLVFPEARRVAIEVRGEERPHLERWYHEVRIGDFRGQRLAELRPDDGPVLLTGNPPYGQTEDVLDWAFDELELGDWIFFLLRQSFGESERASEYFSRRSPTDELNIVGRANFRGGQNQAGERYSADFLGHRWVLWEVGTHPAAWSTRTLPPLPPASMSWAVRPGTEATSGRLHPLFFPKFEELLHEE